MILDLLVTLFACLIFLFVFWVKLREDYTQNQVFTTGLYILFGMGSGNVLANMFLRDWWFWIGLVGGIVGLLIGILRFRLRVFEVLEAFVISGLSLFLILSLLKTIENYSITSLALVFGTSFFIILYLFFDSHYKKFTWYRSGKVGFSGLTVLGLFFLTRSIVAMTNLSMLSFAGDTEVVVSGIMAFLCFMSVYNLSEKN